MSEEEDSNQNPPGAPDHTPIEDPGDNQVPMGDPQHPSKNKKASSMNID